MQDINESNKMATNEISNPKINNILSIQDEKLGDSSSSMNEESNSNTVRTSKFTNASTNLYETLVKSNVLLNDQEITNFYDEISDDDMSNYSNTSELSKTNKQNVKKTPDSLTDEKHPIDNNSTLKPFREIFDQKTDHLKLVNYNQIDPVEQQHKSKFIQKDMNYQNPTTSNPIIKLNDKILDQKTPSPINSSNSCSNSSPESKQLASDVAFVQNVFHRQYFVNDSQEPSQNNNPVSPINEQSNDIETTALLDELDQYEKVLDDITTENENEMIPQSSSNCPEFDLNPPVNPQNIQNNLESLSHDKSHEHQRSSIFNTKPPTVETAIQNTKTSNKESHLEHLLDDIDSDLENELLDEN